MIGALILLFPQFPKVRAWAEGVTLPIWNHYDQHSASSPSSTSCASQRTSRCWTGAPAITDAAHGQIVKARCLLFESAESGAACNFDGGSI